MRHILVTVLLFAMFVPFATHAGVVPCGYGNLPSCNLCHLYTGAKNIIDFLLFDFILPLAIVAFLIGGIFMLASSGNPQMLQTGKTAITNTLLGIFIAFGSWLIIATILNTLGYQNPTAAWNEAPTCKAALEVQPPPPPEPPVEKRYCVNANGNIDLTTKCEMVIQEACTELGGAWQTALPANCEKRYCADGDGNDKTGNCSTVTEHSCTTIGGTWTNTKPNGCLVVDPGIVLGESDARALLSSEGICVNKQPCGGGSYTNPAGCDPVVAGNGCTNIGGMKPQTLQAAIDLKKNCSCQITITGGTEPGHGSGPTSHAAGYKFDVRPNSKLNTYIKNNYPRRGSVNGNPRYTDPATNIDYVDEGDHWDVKVP